MRNPFSPLYLLGFVLLLIFLLVFVQMGLLSLAMEKLGLSMGQGMLLLLTSLFGSAINLPVTSIKAERPLPDEALNENLPNPRRLLHLPMMPFTGHTVIAVNVGGCMVPLVFSISLMVRFSLDLPTLLLAIGVTSAICYAASRPIPGIGIGMPIFIAPLTAALVALFIDSGLAAPLAYISGTLGVLIGADLLRMRDIGKLGTPFASIGGAGTFDGIFLTGIVAVLLT